MRPDQRPAFTDRKPEDFSRQDVNPYVRSHREFGQEILPGSDAPQWKGRWHEHFGRSAPLHLEIGSGNGFYLSGMAELHPEADWIGVELRFKRVELVARKLRAANLMNARIIRYDARSLEDILEPGSLAGIHVNHPDPWERESKRHHRLIGPEFVALAARLAAPGAEFRLKTDFGPHVKALVAAATEADLWDVVGTRNDVDTEGNLWPDDVVTNYQRKARVRGVPVFAALLRRTANGSSISAPAPEPQPQS